MGFVAERLEMSGRLVKLEPLMEVHVDALLDACAEARESYAYTTVPRDRAEMTHYVRALLDARAAGEDVPFVQTRLRDGVVVGATRFLSIRTRESGPLPYAVEIGGTWLSAAAQRTGINPEAKLLLLTHAFDVWKVRRVELQSDARNERSRAAIAALGASLEGVLRAWEPSKVAGEEAELRDTVVYSIIDTEWPRVRRALTARLTSAGPAGGEHLSSRSPGET